MHRREFVKGSISVVALCSGVSVALVGCSSLTYITPIIEERRLVVPRLAMVDLTFVMVKVPDSNRPIYLHQHDADTFTAVSTRCAHKGCQVEPAGTLLICPCHGSEYTLTGTVVKSPAEQDLQAYQVTSDETNIYIHV
jgi:Rieske Fe-S protein